MITNDVKFLMSISCLWTLSCPMHSISSRREGPSMKLVWLRKHPILSWRKCIFAMVGILSIIMFSMLKSSIPHYCDFSFNFLSYPFQFQFSAHGLWLNWFLWLQVVQSLDLRLWDDQLGLHICLLVTVQTKGLVALVAIVYCLDLHLQFQVIMKNWYRRMWLEF